MLEPPLRSPAIFLPFEVRNIFDIGLGHEDMRRPVGDRYDVDLAVDVIAIFQHRTKRRRAAGRLKDDRAVLAPLVARVLAVGNSLHRPQIDVQPLFLEKSLVVSDPHRRQVHGQSRQRCRLLKNRRSFSLELHPGVSSFPDAHLVLTNDSLKSLVWPKKLVFDIQQANSRLSRRFWPDQ